MSIKRPTIIFHIIGWIAFVGLQFLLFPKPDLLIKNGTPTPFLIEQLVINIIAVIFFYLHYYLLLPKFYFTHKYLKYAGCLLVFIAVSFFIIRQTVSHQTLPSDIPTNTQGIPEFNQNPLAPPTPFVKPFRDTIAGENFLLYGIFIIKLLLVFLFTTGLKMYNRWQTAEEEKYKAELAFLKTQINPHFLFNTLNGIYVLAIKKSENTPAAILKLSSIMRYVINEAHHDFVPLASELKYIKDYVELQQMRLAKNIILDFDILATDKTFKIAPLILIPFIENAFKHGISMEENCTIKIHLLQEEETLQLLVQNNKYKNELREEEKSGIGVENTKKRLNILYPEKHQLNVEDTDLQYTILLKIILK